MSEQGTMLTNTTLKKKKNPKETMFIVFFLHTPRNYGSNMFQTSMSSFLGENSPQFFSWWKSEYLQTPGKAH